MRAISIISIIYGVLGLIWGTVVRLLMQIYSALIENMPMPEEVTEIMDVKLMMGTIDSIWRLLYPFIIIISIIYIISGILKLAGKQHFTSLTFIAAILNILWYLAYVIIIQTDLIPIIHMDEFFPENLFNTMIIVGMMINAIFYCGYPIFLIIYLSKERRS